MDLAPGPPRPPVPGGQWKPPPLPGAGMQPVSSQLPGVNGFTAPSNTQGHPNGIQTLPNSFVPHSRPEMAKPPFMNGPNVRPFDGGNQPPRPGMPPFPGQFRPPVVGMTPPASSGLSPAQAGTFTSPEKGAVPPTRPPIIPAQVQPGVPSQPAQTQAERPNELPVPYHGHAQYSHQVGMSLTPGITPANSGPPSQKSSRTNSPAVSSQSFDALEGQFRNTPDQELGSSTPPVTGTQAMAPQSRPGTSTDPRGNLPHPSQQPTMLSSAASQSPRFTHPPAMSGPQGNFPTRPGFQPQFPMSSAPGPTPTFPVSSATGQSLGFQPPRANETPRFPPPVGGMPDQRPGLPPTSLPNQRPGFAPVSSSANQVPGFPPMSTPSQRPGIPPPASAHQPGFPVAPVTANQLPGFPPPPASANQQPGFSPPPASANQQPGFPPPPASANQQPGFPPPTTSAYRQPGFPPSPASANQQPGFPPPRASANQQQGFPSPPNVAYQQPRFPPPLSSANQQPGFPTPPAYQQPGFPTPPASANQQPGFPPPPANQQPGFPPPPAVANQQLGFPPPVSNQHPGFPSQPVSANQQPGFPGQVTQQPPPTGLSQFNQPQEKSIQQFVNTYPTSPDSAALTSNMANMSMQQGSQFVNLLQQKQLIPADGVEAPKPNIPNDFKKVNCNPDVFRCTLNAIPHTSALLSKARLPLGILIHPFKDMSQLPVIQSSVIVRCRSCRTYINPFVYFVDSRRWKCNLCYRVNELPDEFSFDPVTKTYGDPQRRPEIRSATIEFIAPSEYMLRPPQPAVYLYLIDVSFNALETGYLNVFCETLLDVLDKLPGDARTHIGFVAYDSAIHFFNLAEGLSQPQMLTVSDVEDIFLPYPDNLLVNLNESRDLVIDLLNQLPGLFEGNMETSSALGAALQAAAKMTAGTGGRVTVMQTILPTVGPGALQNREDTTQKSSKDVANLGPAIDFYKKLALDCSAQQIAVDLFLFNGQYADMATIECISRFSAGCVHYYPSYHAVRTPHLAEKFEVDLRRYLTRKIGFESVMRIRCSKGMSIHTFHGNFFVRSTDLLSLPNINPDAGYGMQMSIEEALTDMPTMCFQAALLYTSSKGERRIRVHTLCLPVTNQISEVYAAADQQAIVALLAKMAVDRCITSSMSDAREAIVNAAIDSLNAFGSTLTSSQRMGSLCIGESLRLLPLYCLALLKSAAFRTGSSTRLDDRIYALNLCKNLPISYLLQIIHPDLYPVHSIMDVELVKKGSLEVPKLPLLHLSSANIDKFGAYLLDAGERMFLYLGSAISPQFCEDIFDKPNFQALQEGGMSELPELDNPGSERLRNFVTHLLDNRPNGVSFVVAREDGRFRMKFFEHFVEDRTESSLSYYEFLQSIQKQVKS